LAGRSLRMVRRLMSVNDFNSWLARSTPLPLSVVKDFEISPIVSYGEEGRQFGYSFRVLPANDCAVIRLWNGRSYLTTLGNCERLFESMSALPKSVLRSTPIEIAPALVNQFSLAACCEFYFVLKASLDVVEDVDISVALSVRDVINELCVTDGNTFLSSDGGFSTIVLPRFRCDLVQADLNTVWGFVTPPSALNILTQKNETIQMLDAFERPIDSLE
jgi:hypothetical protein